MARGFRAWPTRAVVIIALVLATVLCAGTVEFRLYRTGNSYRFLDWNLFLAWVPFGLALAAYARALRGGRASVAVLSVLWLLFFPNAPYLLSDFIHLGQTPNVPLWYDGLMLSSFAWTGLLLGFASLFLMQQVWRRAGGQLLSWLGVFGSLSLASIGVYLGREFRFNSWDALVHPVQVGQVLLRELTNPLAHRWTAASLLVLTASLLIAYAVLYGIAGLRLDLERERV